jgi:CHAT domain-containing protein
LYRIPYESLVTKSSKTWSTPDIYFISQYEISYLYFIEQLLNPQSSSKGADFLGVGIEYDKHTLESMKSIKADTVPSWVKDKFRSDELSQLLFADDEINAIRAIWGGSAILNQAATRPAVLNKLIDHNILHVSAHSYVDYDQPENSSIILTKEQGDESNLLTLGDIQKLNLKYNLVTLSSCNSASGQIYEGEGVSSLTKGFFEAGSSSVLGSCWSVSDQITKIFMEHYYKELRTGKSKESALRATKLFMMSPDNDLVSPSYKVPAYWAAWVLYGETSIVEKRWHWAYYAALALIILVLILAYNRSRLGVSSRQY